MNLRKCSKRKCNVIVWTAEILSKKAVNILSYFCYFNPFPPPHCFLLQNLILKLFGLLIITLPFWLIHPSLLPPAFLHCWHHFRMMPYLTKFIKNYTFALQFYVLLCLHLLFWSCLISVLCASKTLKHQFCTSVFLPPCPHSAFSSMFNVTCCVRVHFIV